MTYNDGGDSYDEVRTLIVEARARAQAELEEARDRRRANTVIPVTARSPGDRDPSATGGELHKGVVVVAVEHGVD
jgi:hypothetical protein